MTRTRTNERAMTMTMNEAAASNSRRLKKRKGQLPRGPSRRARARRKASAQQAAASRKAIIRMKGVEERRMAAIMMCCSSRSGKRQTAFGEEQREGFGEQLLHGGFLFRRQHPQTPRDLGIEVASDVTAFDIAGSGGARGRGRIRRPRRTGQVSTL